MHIVIGSDDNYVPGVLVLVASAAWHNPGARFTVLDMDISTENRVRIDALAVWLGVRIDRIEVAGSTFAGLAVHRLHLTESAFLRLAIPGLLSDEERVIYMDCDMAVTGDLSQLEALPLDDALIAAVADLPVGAAELAATGARPGEYVNSGLLVMNLPTWRRDGIAEACLAFLGDPDQPRHYEDQSAINAICRGRVVHLPARFNVFAGLKTYTSPEDVPTDHAVLHYVAGAKPWVRTVPFSEVWQFHADRIRDLMPPPLRPSWRRRLAGLNRRLRRTVGLALGRRRYLQRREMEQAIRDRVVEPYLHAQRGRRP